MNVTFIWLTIGRNKYNCSVEEGYVTCKEKELTPEEQRNLFIIVAGFCLGYMLIMIVAFKLIDLYKDKRKKDEEIAKINAKLFNPLDIPLVPMETVDE
jgi:hypothetical protein